MEKDQKDNGSHHEIQIDVVESCKDSESKHSGPIVDMNMGSCPLNNGVGGESDEASRIFVVMPIFLKWMGG